mmetsp:Transcript_23229/g.34415  ORF Transcript_23229/g.34415 Transcript_23229/m.34415 type:complete len:145 (-) Transcript_23229:3010-3444(-)
MHVWRSIHISWKFILHVLRVSESILGIQQRNLKRMKLFVLLNKNVQMVTTMLVGTRFIDSKFQESNSLFRILSTYFRQQQNNASLRNGYDHDLGILERMAAENASSRSDDAVVVVQRRNMLQEKRKKFDAYSSTINALISRITV